MTDDEEESIRKKYCEEMADLLAEDSEAYDYFNDRIDEAFHTGFSEMRAYPIAEILEYITRNNFIISERILEWNKDLDPDSRGESGLDILHDYTCR